MVLTSRTTGPKGAETRDIKHSDQPLPFEPSPGISASSTTSSTAPRRSEDTTILPVPLTFPPITATASTVRTYIRSFLHHNAINYDLSEADVLSLAGAWRNGSGEELRIYERWMWDSLFAREMGQVLYRHVQSKIEKEKQEVQDRSQAINFIGMILTPLAILCATLVLIYVPMERDNYIVTAFVFVLLIIAPCIAGFIYLAWDLREKRRLVAEADGEIKKRALVQLKANDDDYVTVARQRKDR